MGWGRRKQRVRKAVLVRDLDYVHEVMGPFYLPAGDQVILTNHDKVIDKLVLDAYNKLKQMGANPVIIEHKGRYYVTSPSNLREDNQYAPRGNKFRRNR